MTEASPFFDVDILKIFQFKIQNVSMLYSLEDETEYGAIRFNHLIIYFLVIGKMIEEL